MLRDEIKAQYYQQSVLLPVAIQVVYWGSTKLMSLKNLI